MKKLAALLVFLPPVAEACPLHQPAPIADALARYAVVIGLAVITGAAIVYLRAHFSAYRERRRQ